jgi:hypothetical protein
MLQDEYSVGWYTCKDEETMPRDEETKPEALGELR